MARRKIDYTNAVQLLKGEENLEDWKDDLMVIANAADLRDYLLESVPAPEGRRGDTEYDQWRQDRADLTVILTTSLSKVKQELRNGGLSRFEDDPYVIYKKVCEVIPRQSEGMSTSLVERLLITTPEDFDSIKAYQEDCQLIRRSLEEMGKCPPEDFMVEAVIIRLRDCMPEDYPFLIRDARAHRLNWDGLMSEITRFIKSQKPSKGVSAAAIRQGRGRPSSSTTTTTSSSGQKKEDQTKMEKILEILPNLKGAPRVKIDTLRWCEKCEGFKWKDNGHHDACGSCHPFKKCPNYKGKDNNTLRFPHEACPRWEHERQRGLVLNSWAGPRLFVTGSAPLPQERVEPVVLVARSMAEKHSEGDGGGTGLKHSRFVLIVEASDDAVLAHLGKQNPGVLIQVELPVIDAL